MHRGRRYVTRVAKQSRLGALTSLETLRLGSNRLNSLSGFSALRNLSKLRVLDLSYNAISDIPFDSIPASVRFLDLRGNPACQNPSYRDNVTEKLPHLIFLDDAPVNMTTWSHCKGVDHIQFDTFLKNELVDDEKLANLRMAQELFYKI